MKLLLAALYFFLAFAFGTTALVQIITFKPIADFLPLILFQVAMAILFTSLGRKRLKQRVELKKSQMEIEKRNQQITKLFDGASNSRLRFEYLGGSGYDFPPQSSYDLGVMKDEIRLLSSDNNLTVVKFSEVKEFEVTGPGTTTKNAGISGGGFGLEGFIKGAVTAAAINAITTSSSTNTFLKLTTTIGELYLHTSMCEPDQLRMMLSPLSVRIANRNTSNGQPD